MNSFSSNIDGKDKIEAIQDIARERETPRGFYERRTGIVAPENLRDSGPQITLNGYIHEDMFGKLSETLNRLEAGDKRLNSLNVNFSSFGGSVTIGFGVHDLLRVFGRKHKIPITMTGYGPIMSMGVLIMQAGDVRQMPRNSRMLLHPPSTTLHDGVDRIEHRVEESRALYTFYTEIVAERVRQAGKEMTPEQIRELMKANDGVGTYLTSQQALEFGLIDEVI